MRIFKEEYVRQLFIEVQSPNRQKDYTENNLSFLEQNQSIDWNINVNGEMPILDKSDKSDGENAEKLYKYLGDLPLDFVKDLRLWTSLTHLHFNDYTFGRWIEGSSKNPIKERYFTLAFGNDRSLVRNAIARLWLGAFLTVKNNNDDFSYYFKKFDDDFIYTKTLFSLQEIQMQLLEHSYGRNKKLLLSVLHYFKQNEKKLNRNIVRDFTKKLCIVIQHTKLFTMKPEDIFKYYKTYLPIK